MPSSGSEEYEHGENGWSRANYSPFLLNRLIFRCKELANAAQKLVIALIGAFGCGLSGGFSAATRKGRLWQRPRLVNMEGKLKFCLW